MSIPNEPALPLAGLRVVELSDGKAEMCGRLLADLGADVVLVEPPAGARSRRMAPMVEGASLYFSTHNANKRGVAIDLAEPAGRERFRALLSSADIFIETTTPGTLDALGLGAAGLRATHPELVVLSITDFGQDGPYASYAATNSVLMAMGGVLCRSGLPGLVPLLPPGSLAIETAAVQAAWVALLAYWQRLHTGVGDHLDFSLHEATAQILDPALGITGSASAGQSARELAVVGRPPINPLYPIFPCADGYVRICVLSPRQWEGMSEWLGPDHPFTDPSYSALGKRGPAAGKINLLIAELFKSQPAAELVAQGQKRGVPIAAVAAPGEVLKDEHFAARGSFVDWPVAPGIQGRVPAGYLEINGRRAGLRTPAPTIGQHDADFPPSAATPAPAGEGKTGRRPLEGLRVLDMGVIVAGAEAGRVFADQGAEVIKIETKAFPDGGRQSRTGDPMTHATAAGHRNKESLGINLRSDRGRELFKQLAAKSDVILSNFKPGTLDSLGLGYDVLKKINRGIVMGDSSALGNTGPQSRTLGYGPLVRASSGLTRLWCYPDVDNSFSDGVTIFPDHFAARVMGVGVLSTLIARRRTGEGGTVSVSQAETFLTANSEHFLRESLQPGTFVPRGNVSENTAPDGVFPCAGEDQWAVVSVRDDADWGRLLGAIGREDLRADGTLATAAGRLERRAEVDAALSDWTRRHTPHEVTRILQAAGVPAGFMRRLHEYEDDPHLQARGFFRTLVQPGLPAPILMENGPVKALNLPDPDLRPAPFLAQHTREVAARLLGLSPEQIEESIAAGDLEETPRPKTA